VYIAECENGWCYRKRPAPYRNDAADYRWIEMITGASRRRRWSADEKVAVVAESFQAGVNFSALARRTGVNRGLLRTWRRAAMCAASDGELPVFVPIHISSAGPEPGAPPAMHAPMQDRATAAAEASPVTIEIESGDLRVRVHGSVDMGVLRAVLSRVRGTPLILGVPTRPGLRIMLASQPTDFRKGIDGLVT
jgi:transposase